MDLSRGSVNASSELASKCTVEEQGIERLLEFVGQPQPDMYSAELSLFVLEAGVKLLEARQPLISYLSLTDYVQHKYAPGEAEADRYYRDMDTLFGRLDAMGVTLAITADHGMNDKSRARRLAQRDLAAGHPGRRVRQGREHGDLPHHRPLRRAPRGPGRVRARVLPRQPRSRGRHPGRCAPCRASRRPTTSGRRRASSSCPWTGRATSSVVGRVDTCIGASEADHDLSGLRGHRLRTHGALHESRVPVHPEPPAPAGVRGAGGAGRAAQLPPLRLRHQRRRVATTMADRAGRHLRDGERAVHRHGVPGAASGAGEALARVAMSTICRSDIHSYEGRRPNPTPCILGHEIIGVIEELGPGVGRDCAATARPGRPRDLDRVLLRRRLVLPRRARHAQKSRGLAQVRPRPRRRGPALHGRFARVLLHPARHGHPEVGAGAERRGGDAAQLRGSHDGRGDRGSRHRDGRRGRRPGARAAGPLRRGHRRRARRAPGDRARCGAGAAGSRQAVRRRPHDRRRSRHRRRGRRGRARGLQARRCRAVIDVCGVPDVIRPGWPCCARAVATCWADWSTATRT